MSEVRNMMLEDSKDLLDNVEVTTVADECVKLKKIEDEIAAIEEQLKKKTMLSKLNEKIEENLQEDKSTNPFGKNLRANIL